MKNKETMMIKALVTEQLLAYTDELQTEERDTLQMLFERCCEITTKEISMNPGLPFVTFSDEDTVYHIPMDQVALILETKDEEDTDRLR
jgi:hypothetical protein